MGRFDDGNAEDGRTVDEDIELVYVVGEDVDNNEGTSEGIVGFVVGIDVGVSLRLTGGESLGNEDGIIEGLKDEVALDLGVG